MTAELASAIVEEYVEFFTPVFTKEDCLTQPKSVYATIINAPYSNGATLETLLGSTNAQLEMKRIMFHLTTGSFYVAPRVATAKPATRTK